MCETLDGRCYARSMDPVTSQEAAEDASDALGTLEKLDVLLWFVRKYPGRTALEYHKKICHRCPVLVASWGGQQTGNFACRNLSKLAKQEKVERGEIRKCRVNKNGRRSVTWWPKGD